MEDNLLTAYINIIDFEIFYDFDSYVSIYEQRKEDGEEILVFSGKKLNREEFEEKTEEYEKLLEGFYSTPIGTFAYVEENSKLYNVFKNDNYSLNLQELTERSKVEIKKFKKEHKDLINFLEKNQLAYEIEFGLFNATWC